MIRNLFHGLRGKLILTYTAVTVLALLALEIVVLLVLLTLSNLIKADRNSYLSDIYATLVPAARFYLQPESTDIEGLQGWLEGVYASGKASLDAQDWFDSPAALLIQGEPMYVLSTDRTVLAQAPHTENSLIGRTYTPPNTTAGQEILDNAYRKITDPQWISMKRDDGNYMMAVPIIGKGEDGALLGVIIVTVEPPPPITQTIWPYIVGWVVVTGIILLIAVAPLGALFGLVMSRGLTRRLNALTAAADAWSEGNFSVQPQDNSNDEISLLSRRLRNMAERVQNLLQTQQELAMVEERNRLARELHDTVKQQAFATLMQVRAARNLIATHPDEAAKRLEEAEGLIKTTQQDLGQMISELRPPALEGQGLGHALGTYIDVWSQNSHVPASFQVKDERRLALDKEQAFYRIAQEALSNVMRHSRASAVSIQLVFAANQVCMTISDNGVGFEPTGKSSGFGLKSMHERAEAMGGILTVDSSQENGTTLTITAPAT